MIDTFRQFQTMDRRIFDDGRPADKEAVTASKGKESLPGNKGKLPLKCSAWGDQRDS